MILRCLICNGKFNRPKAHIKSKNQFCSIKCYQKFRGQLNQLKGGHFKCLFCGHQFYRKPFDIKNGNNKFCSKNCYLSWQKGRPKSERLKAIWRDGRRKGKNSHFYGKSHSLWKNPEYVKKVLKGKGKKPNQLEKFFDKLTPKTVRYVGDGSWWRTLSNGNHKNPDFKVTGRNKVIEIFGNYWHREDDPEILINLYKQIGIDCMIIWEKEIHANPLKIVGRINEFIA